VISRADEIGPGGAQRDPARSNEGGVMTEFHELEMKAITGESVHFSEFKNRYCLIVNVASR